MTAAGPRAGACRLRGVGRRCLAPVGKGRCRCAGSTLFALRAKALQSGAPDHGVSRERAGFSERFAHQGTLPARRRTGERAAPRRGRRYTPSRRQNAPFSRQNLPHHPTAANAALYKARLIARVSRRTSRCVPPAFRTCLQPTRAFYDLSAPFTAHPAPFTAHPTPFAAYSALFTAYSAPFTAFPHLLRPLHACLRPIRAFNSHPVPFYGFPTPFTTRPPRAAPFTAPTAPFTTCPHLLRPICAFYGLPAPVCGYSAPFTALPRPQRAASYPSRHRLHPPDIPRGERRALPAPAQGSRPLRIPFGEPAPVFPVSPSPKRRRRTAPARGPSAVYALCR